MVSEEMFFKEIVDARTHARTMDDGQWAITKAHLEHFVLRWAKKWLYTESFALHCIKNSLVHILYFAMKFTLIIDSCRKIYTIIGE